LLVQVVFRLSEDHEAGVVAVSRPVAAGVVPVAIEKVDGDAMGVEELEETLIETELPED
jgi:hypothetical protein